LVKKAGIPEEISERFLSTPPVKIHASGDQLMIGI
jgi:hypothetical protein